MKRLASALVAALVLLPGLALADVVDLPRLDFPDTVAGPATQGCIQPATLSGGCAQGE